MVENKNFSAINKAQKKILQIYFSSFVNSNSLCIFCKIILIYEKNTEKTQIRREKENVLSKTKNYTYRAVKIK